MQQKPLSLLQFQKKFGTEKACQKQLFRMRWPGGFEIGQVMVPGNEVIGSARHGAFQDAVVRKAFDNGNGFRWIDDMGKALNVVDDFSGPLHLPAEFPGQNPFDFFDDERGGGVADVPFPGQLQDGFGVAAEVEGRNNDIGVNHYL